MIKNKKQEWLMIKCPFCGNVETLACCTADEIDPTYDMGDSISYAVNCPANNGGCGATGGYAETESEAIKKWNMRCHDETVG